MGDDRRAAFLEAAAPLLAALEKEGLPTAGFGQFQSRRANELLGPTPPFDYEHAVPVLLEWLPRIDDARVKEAIVRSLATKYARPTAAPALINEFKSASGDAFHLRWAIGNSLEVVSDRSVFDGLAELARQRSYGRAREMVVVALARTKHPDAPGLLIDLLGDDEIAGHAVVALRKLAPIGARPYLEPFEKDPRPWVRREARRAIEKIDKRRAS